MLHESEAAKETIYVMNAQSPPNLGSNPGSEDNSNDADENIERGPIQLIPAQKKVYYAGKEIALTAREAKILGFLMQNANKIIERKQILDYVWGSSFNPFSNVVDVHIKNLRHKLNDEKEQPLIETIWGSGYRLRIPDKL